MDEKSEPEQRVKLPRSLETQLRKYRVDGRPDGVLDQGIAWMPERWHTAKLADHWPLIDELARRSDPAADDRDQRIVRRRHVFEFADTGAVGSFLAAMIWGYGPIGYGPGRVGSIVEAAGAELRPELQDLAVAARAGAAPAWEALVRTHKLRGLGPAFGTKVVYFATFDVSADTPQPLIADINTSWAVWSLVKIPRSVERADSYIRYVELVDQWAREGGWRADEIERALFEIGKGVSRTV